MLFGVDFDGTVVEHKFPEIGEELPDAIRTMIDLQAAGHQIIIWTCRCGYEISTMLKWLNDREFRPDAVNTNLRHTPGFAVPKIYVDIYFDDRSFPPFPGWDVVREKFLENK